MEVLLRTLLADAGRPENLVAAVRATREQAETMYRDGMEMLQEYADGDVACPERTHLNLLWAAFVRDLLQLVVDWTAFVEAEATAWHGPADRGRTQGADDLLRRLVSGQPVIEPTA